MAPQGEMRPIRLRQDLMGLIELTEIAFADELASRGEDLRESLLSVRRLIPLLGVLGALSEDFRHLLDGFVWEDGGRLVASTIVQRMGHDKTRWYVGSVATHPDYRRQGLARKLTTRALEHAKEHGAEVCILDVRADNPAAYDLYRSLGFTHYDSSTDLKLEQLPEVEGHDAPGYVLRPMELSEWRARYDLQLRATPAEVQAFLPVSEDQYQVSSLQRLLAPLLQRLQGVDIYRWVAERDGQAIGYLRLVARRVAKTAHEMDWSIDPGHQDAPAEALLTMALHTMKDYPAQNILLSVRTSSESLLALLKRYGFVEIETLHRLGVKLDGRA